VLAATLDGAGANLEAASTGAVIVPARLVVRDGGEGLLNGLSLGAILFEVGEPALELAVPERIEGALGPVRGEIGLAIDSVGGVPEGLAGMLPVDHLDGIGEVLVGQAPNPGGAITDHHDLVGLSDAAPKGFEPEQAAERLGTGQRHN